MKKIPTLFKRDFSKPGNPITSEYNDGTEWVIRGEGKATKKYDGTSVLIEDGVMWKRYELKPGREAPYGFRVADKDETTGKTMGWVEVGNGNEDKWHREAWDNLDASLRINGTYELVGPKIQGNPEKGDDHRLVWHEDAQVYPDAPVTFDELREWLDTQDTEGIVWHHPDGRMVKIKKKDFGMKR